ncbi:MAG: hypothetical protein Q4D29_12830, partial [Lachnospiraceae bacterium]|nr:hypothetical protein [Lachnospiraceae bacterium]
SGFANGFANIKGRFPKIEITGEAKVTDIHALRGEEKSHVGNVKLKFNKTRIICITYRAICDI